MQVTIARQLGLDASTVSNFFMNARRRSIDKWREDSPPPSSLSSHHGLHSPLDGGACDSDGGCPSSDTTTIQQIHVPQGSMVGSALNSSNNSGDPGGGGSAGGTTTSRTVLVTANGLVQQLNQFDLSSPSLQAGQIDL